MLFLPLQNKFSNNSDEQIMDPQIPFARRSDTYGTVDMGLERSFTRR